MECGGKCIKWLLFLFNFIFFLMGIGLIAVGAYLNVEHDDWKDISDFNYISVANVAIAAGVIIVIVCFCGCFGAVTENKIFIMIFFVCIVFIFFLEMGAGIAAYVKRGDVEAELKKQIHSRVPSRYYTETGIKAAVDAVQKWWNCCGINSAADYYVKPATPTAAPTVPNVPTVPKVPTVPSDAQLKLLLASADKDGNGKVDVTEAAPIVKQMVPGTTDQQVLIYFTALDVDKNGDLSESELMLISNLLTGGMSMSGLAGALSNAGKRRRRDANAALARQQRQRRDANTTVTGYTLVAEKKECGGAEQCTSEDSSTWYASLESCATHCKGKSNMFAYGTNEFGTSPMRCKNGKCMCCCETASKDGVCTAGQADHLGYRLYKFPTPASKKYQHHAKACVTGHNIKLYSDKSIAECEALCENDKACKGFEYGVAHGGSTSTFKPRDCQPQSSADTKAYPLCDGVAQNLDFYEKLTPVCKGVSGKKCIFPFTYSGTSATSKTFNACTAEQNIKMWCATEVTNGEMVVGSGGWEECDDMCFVGQDYWFVETKKECTKSGSGIELKKKKTVQACADACRSQSTMFIYGTNDYGLTRCDGTGCDCWCQTGATAHATCNRITHNGYNLYRTVGRAVPVNCEWNDWVAERCSSACDAGTRSFSRTKKVVEANGGTCIGASTKTEPCNNVCCEWNNWTAGNCSSTCRDGTKLFTRTKKVVEIGEGICIGKPTENRFCRNTCSPNYVPESCCKETSRKLGTCQKIGNIEIEYWEESALIKSQFHWSTGCYASIRKFILDNLVYIGITGIIFALIQILGMILSMILFCKIRKEQDAK